MSGLFKKRLDDSAGSRMEHPASKSWIFFTFLLAFVLCIVFGEIFWAPDFVALTLIFWTLREPDRVGFLTAFICGILMDALFGTVLGQQSLAYVTLCYLTFALSRRLPSFDLFGQSLHILPVLLISQLFVMLVRLWFDGLWPGWEWFLASVTGALLWGIWTKLLTPRALRSASL